MKKLEDIVLKKGDIVEYNDRTVLLVDSSHGNRANIFQGEYYKIKSIKRPTGYETIYEAPQPILDKAEKEYLENVIRPFKDKTDCVEKATLSNSLEYIRIDLSFDGISLPVFKKDTMYKRMKADKEYTLEELGLFK